MNQHRLSKTHGGVFITGRPKSGNTTIDQIPDEIDHLFGQQYQQSAQKEIDKLQLEQEQYDAVNDIQYRLMELRSDMRKQGAQLESAKQQLSLTDIIVASQMKSLQTTIKYSLEKIQNKLDREIGSTSGFNEFMIQQLGQSKKEDYTIKNSINQLTKRIEQLEFELGIENIDL